MDGNPMKAGSSADLRVVSNDGPVGQGLAALGDAQGVTEGLINQFRHALHSVLADRPTSQADSETKRELMETPLNEALYQSNERQRYMNSTLAELLGRVRL